MTDPGGALRRLAEQLREEDSVISSSVRESSDPPAFGALAAAGHRASAAPAEYALLVETIREGYLLHYGEARVVSTTDRDLALLAGDYLYARGLERLAALGDLDAVGELSDLISLSAQLHAEGTEAPSGVSEVWLASAVAVAVGRTPDHERAKAAIRSGEDARDAVWLAALAAAERAGIADALARAAQALDFHPPDPPNRG